MKSKTKDRPQSSSSRIARPSSWTRAVLATLLVLAGVVAAAVTVLARRENESGLAAAAAVWVLMSGLQPMVRAAALYNTAPLLALGTVLLLATTAVVVRPDGTIGSAAAGGD